MKSSLLLILAILIIGIAVIPASAVYEITNGTFGYSNGFFQDTKIYVSSAAPHGYQSIDGFHFKKIEEYPTLDALKLYAEYPDDFIKLNTTLNQSYAPASIWGSTGKVSDGIFGYSRNGWTGAWYIYYFATTWDITGLTGEQFLSLHYDNSIFDLTGNYIADPLTNDRDLGFSESNWLQTFAGYNAGGYHYSSVVEYTDEFINKWYFYKDTPGDLYYRIRIEKIFTFPYSSQIVVNITASGVNQTVFNKYSNTDEFIDGLHPSNFPYYIDFIAKGGLLHESVRLDAPVPPVTADNIIVRVYDGSNDALFSGATVIKTDIDHPAFPESGVTVNGVKTFTGLLGHNYNFSATATGYTTDYINWTPYHFPTLVELKIYPTGAPPAGTGYLDFKTVTSSGASLSYVTIHLKEDGQTRITRDGFARFNVTAPTFFNYVASLTGYKSAAGNVTSVSAGIVPIKITMFTEQEVAPTPAPVQCTANDQCAKGYVCEKGTCVHYDMNEEIGKLVDWIASTILTLGVLIWLTLVFTVIGMFMLALRSIGGGSGTLFRTGLFPKNLFGRGGRRR